MRLTHFPRRLLLDLCVTAAGTTCAGPFHRAPDFGVTSVDDRLAELLARADEPA